VKKAAPKKSGAPKDFDTLLAENPLKALFSLSFVGGAKGL